jgi:hypothetical protein
VIKHFVFVITLDARKSCAELKVTVSYPKDATSSRMPSRASPSSSTIAINGGAWIKGFEIHLEKDN